MENLSSSNEAEGYKKRSLSVQKVDGEMFIQTDVCPQAGDTILDLGCGTGELFAYMAELVGPEGKVVGVDPDEERLLLAQQCYGEVKNLSFVEALQTSQGLVRNCTMLFSVIMSSTGSLTNKKPSTICLQVLEVEGRWPLSTRTIFIPLY